MKTSLVQEDRVEVHIEVEEEGEAASPTTNPQWNAISATSWDIFNLSVQAGIRKPTTLK